MKMEQVQEEIPRHHGHRPDIALKPCEATNSDSEEGKAR